MSESLRWQSRRRIRDVKAYSPINQYIKNASSLQVIGSTKATRLQQNHMVSS